MDERFNKWLNIYDEFAEGTALRDILNDAIRCYRNDLARPSLMLSYIAFIQAVRDNLLNSEMPDGFKENRWKSSMKNLRSETKWDDEVLNCIKMRSSETELAFFEIADSLRDDVCYWRNRRNDCAHYKSSEIGLSHVSAFWMFMMDHYKEFTPLGSLAQCINDYKRHYDLSLTPEGTSTERIFKRLSLAIKTEEDLLTFLKETSSVMNLSFQFLLLHQLLNNEKHGSKVIGLLKRDIKNIRRYLYFFPHDVSRILGDDPKLLRKLWYDGFQQHTVCIYVYAEMLRAKLIPKNEVEESLCMFLKYEYRHNSLYVENNEDLKVLFENGVYDIFVDQYISKDFICSNPSEKCHKTDFYISMIEEGGITEHFIKTLSESFKGTFPYTLKDRLKSEIFSRKENKEKYQNIIKKLQLADFLKL